MRCAHATYGTCTLTHASYGVSKPTDAHSREPTFGDGLMRLRRLETLCVRSPHVQTECLHEATARDGVCTKKARQPTHLHVFMRHYKNRAHMISSIGFVHAGPCACPHACFTLACPIFYFNLNLFILDIFFLLLLYFSLCNTCTL